MGISKGGQRKALMNAKTCHLCRKDVFGPKAIGIRLFSCHHAFKFTSLKLKNEIPLLEDVDRLAAGNLDLAPTGPQSHVHDAEAWYRWAL